MIHRDFSIKLTKKSLYNKKSLSKNPEFDEIEFNFDRHWFFFVVFPKDFQWIILLTFKTNDNFMSSES